ncbi:hypothetical protein BO94DRAFT_548141 [Aspergillus sclerotioniger CBS 115572]|uniref:Uncharacterized protein n=1 Tax=Aspergillus sclerotioniger CBS 115572 TaxID=1450535 RepID=A0A317W498_9EURO|nr:hypothetical protein BO94DRAFT_548141 [Aspergillus sclerotioniger CBS 115572]PWY80845.1 hypothetical protein BO94DRAFT_548141 [Aspergillus sclerotioniger CBS 115572]
MPHPPVPHFQASHKAVPSSQASQKRSSRPIFSELYKASKHPSRLLTYRTLWVRNMPSELHDACQRWVIHAYGRWMQDGLLTALEGKEMGIGVNTGMTCTAHQLRAGS